MPKHVRMLRGKFDPARLREATSFAESVDDQLRRSFDEYDHLVTLRQPDGRFVWLAFFNSLCPIGQDAIADRFQAYQHGAREAAIDFEIDEFGAYEITYPPDAES